MKCYKCKKTGLTSATRVFMEARDRREKPGYRNVCDDCYSAIMHEHGYRLIDGVWYSQYSEPPQRNDNVSRP